MALRRSLYPSVIEALDALLRSLISYEQKHQMSSDEFYERYLAGELEDSREFVEWAGDYQHYMELKKEMEKKLKVSS